MEIYNAINPAHPRGNMLIYSIVSGQIGSDSYVILIFVLLIFVVLT